MGSAYFYEYNCANMNQITRRKVESSINTEIEQFEHLKEEFNRLCEDYNAINASNKAMEGLYTNFLQGVYRLLSRNASKKWFAELERRIRRDKTFYEVSVCMGDKSGHIEKRVRRNVIFNRFKQHIKNKLKM